MTYLRTAQGHSTNPLRSLPINSPTGLALEVLGAEELMAARREEILDNYFLTCNTCTVQPFTTYRKLLLTANAYAILKIVWKESSFVSDEELAVWNMSKTYPEGFNAHMLAKGLADTLHDLSKIQNTITRVFHAATTFDLIQRSRLRPVKGYAIFGTEALHKLMLRLAQAQKDFVQHTIACDPDSPGDTASSD